MIYVYNLIVITFTLRFGALKPKKAGGDSWRKMLNYSFLIRPKQTWLWCCHVWTDCKANTCNCFSWGFGKISAFSLKRSKSRNERACVPHCLWALWWPGIPCRSQHFSHGRKDYKGFCPLLTTVQPLGLWMELEVLNRNKNMINALKSTTRNFFFFTAVVARQREERERKGIKTLQASWGCQWPPA